MNKTLTVNIGGLVFHIEELAYLKLDQYLNAIKSSISIQEQEEVIHDIEIRIAELFSENITSSNQVITLADVDRIILIMGRPEDYKLHDDENEFTDSTQYVYTKQPKLYRDTQKGIIGGVLAGLGHYFKLDVVWIRIIFLVLLFFYGTGVLLYLIMWAIIPAARTSSEILEMQGEPININTIEKKVKENIDYVTNKFNTMDTEAIKKQMTNSSSQVGQIIQKFAGIFFTLTALLGLLGTAIASIAISVNTARLSVINDDIFPSIIQETYPTWFFITLLSLIMILPFIGLLLIGLRLLYNNIKYVLALVISLFIAWVISIVLFSIPFMNIKTYEKMGNFTLNEMSIGGLLDKVSISDDFDLDKQYNEIKIVAVSPEFFKTDRSDATPYILTDSVQINTISFDILPTSKDKIHGEINFEYNSKEKSTTTVTISSLLDFFDIEKNVLYVSANTIQGTTTPLKWHYTLFLPRTTKVFFANHYQSVSTNFEGKIDKNTYYTMNEDNMLIQAELH